MTAEITHVALRCAREAAEMALQCASDSDLEDADYPHAGWEPLDGDWEDLEIALGRAPTEDERAEFEESYASSCCHIVLARVDQHEEAERARLGGHYAFEFFDGRHTTTGDHPHYRIAGTLLRFGSCEARDAWVDGSSTKTREPIGDGDALPSGWRVWDADVHDLAPAEGDYGTLCDYQSGEALRPATTEERASSLDAAKSDGGSGVIVVDGRSCYVES